MSDDGTGNDPSMAVEVDKLLASVEESVEETVRLSEPPPPPAGPTPPPLPAPDLPAEDESLAVHVDELLASVAESVEVLEPDETRHPVEPTDSYVVLSCRDLARAQRFYEELLGCTVEDETEALVRLRVAAGLALWLTTAEIAEPPGTLRLVVADLERTHARLLASDVNVVAPPSERAWGRSELVLLDPDGHRLIVAGA